MATIIDVARLAGVSTSTVSHVVNGTRNVAPATRDRVLAAISSMDYHLHGPARALRRARTDTIALVISEAGYPVLELRSMNVLLGPAHMTLALRQRVAQDVTAAAKEKEIVDKLRTSGQQEVGVGPAEAAKALEEQAAQVARLAKTLGMARKK